MAQLDSPTATTPGAPSKLRLGGSTIPATTQLLAIAWMRWRMFANGFVRRSTTPRQIAGLVFTILLRLLVWPIFAMMAIGPAAGAGFLAYFAVAGHHPQRLVPLLAGVAVFWQFIAVNGVSMAATLSNFDPASLLRFPLRFPRYLVLRLLLGLLTPSTIIGCLALFAAVIGIGIAQPSLIPAAFVVLAVYAAMNIFFSRMIAVWLERWLSTRRAREIFGGLMALFFVSFQFLTYRSPGSHRHAGPATGSWLLTFLHSSNRALDWLPPGFAAQSILLTAHPLAHLPALVAQFAALLLWTAAFFAAFALRLHQQFLGEYLSEGAPRTFAPTPRTPTTASPLGKPSLQAWPSRSPKEERGFSPGGMISSPPPTNSLFPPTIAACLRKEWVYLRGNSGQIISMLTPLIFVFIFARGMLAQHPSYLLAGSVGYVLLGPLATLYNIFGADGPGTQLYLLAPVRLRDVILAKNLASLALLLVEVVLTWSLVSALATAPIPLSTQISTVFWIAFMLFANLALGTLRSIQAPRKIAIAQARRVRNPSASKTSGLLVLAILFGSMLLQIPVTLLCDHFHNPWLAALIFAPLAAAAVAAYGLLLWNADRLILTHRDLFAQDLCGD